jgi:uncharacterized protein YggE
MKILLCLLLLIPAFAKSQTALIERTLPEANSIEVVGTATKEIRPDIIILSIALSEKDNNGKQYTIEQQDVNLRKILASLDIPSSELLLSDISSQLITFKAKEQSARRTKEYSLELQKAEQVSALLQGLAEAGIKEVAVTKVDHTKIDSLTKEVRILAIRAAKEKAIYLTQAIRASIGNALQIREIGQEMIYSPFSEIASNVSTRESSPETEKVDFRYLKISSSIFVKFALP